MRRTTNFCDHCESVVSSFAMTVRDHRAEKDSYELCDECAEALKMWVAATRGVPGRVLA